MFLSQIQLYYQCPQTWCQAILKIAFPSKRKVTLSSQCVGQKFGRETQCQWWWFWYGWLRWGDIGFYDWRFSVVIFHCSLPLIMLPPNSPSVNNNSWLCTQKWQKVVQIYVWSMTWKHFCQVPSDLCMVECLVCHVRMCRRWDLNYLITSVLQQHLMKSHHDLLLLLETVTNPMSCVIQPPGCVWEGGVGQSGIPGQPMTFTGSSLGKPPCNRSCICHHLPVL